MSITYLGFPSVPCHLCPLASPVHRRNAVSQTSEPFWGVWIGREYDESSPPSFLPGHVVLWSGSGGLRQRFQLALKRGYSVYGGLLSRFKEVCRGFMEFVAGLERFTRFSEGVSRLYRVCRSPIEMRGSLES